MVILHVRVKNEISDSLILVSGPKSKVDTIVKKKIGIFRVGFRVPLLLKKWYFLRHNRGSNILLDVKLHIVPAFGKGQTMYFEVPYKLNS